VTDVDQIFRVIQGLPVRDQLRLLERIAHALANTSAPQPEPRSAEPAPSLLGLFADEPDLIDEVSSMAMEARKRDKLRASGEDR
jgi:hypothetical protein